MKNKCIPSAYVERGKLVKSVVCFRGSDTRQGKERGSARF